MSAAAPVFDTFLRLVGLFYLVGAAFVLRAAARDRLLAGMLDALAPTEPREKRADGLRRLLLSLNAVLMGGGGVLLLALLEPAAPVFAASLLFYGLYLFWLAPGWIDPIDPPSESGRRQQRRAIVLYAAATALVVARWWAGGLRPLGAENAWTLSLVALLAALLLGYGLKLFWNTRGLARHGAASRAAAGNEERHEP